MSRVFVTGATGFLGRHLVDQLLAAEHEVVALVRSDPSPPLPEGVTLRRGDVTDGASVRDACDGCELAYHCAGLVSRLESDAGAMYEVHVSGTKATLTALEQAGIRRVVVASTSGTVAITEDPDEIRSEGDDAPLGIIARWPYYRSKLFAEQAALEMNSADFEVVAVLPSLLLGPGDLHGSSTDDIRKFMERKIPFSPAGGMAFVDARDAAAALILAMDKGEPGQRYLVNAANMPLSVFFGRLERITGVKAPPLRMPRTPVTLAGVGADLIGRAAKAMNMTSPIDRISAEMSQYYWYCNAERAERDLGWLPRDPGETLFDTIADMRARGVVWPA
jgi:nucleoside-diphosphate-sugar epimerase